MNFGMVAGEASGDLLAAQLLSGLQQRWPGLAAAGIGGPLMAARGFQAWWPSQRLAVHGYAEALKAYGGLVALRRALGDRLLKERPAAFIGIDAPDFNLGLEARLKAAGIKTLHFVCPSIWAWRGERVHKLAASADHVLCLFPFEPPLLAKAGVPASFVGHPLADAMPMQPPRVQARAALGLAQDATVVAVLPGSRRSEIRHIAPAFVAAVQRLQAARPQVQALLPVAPGMGEAMRAVLAGQVPPPALRLVEGHSHDVLAACDVAMVASGTATLEAALLKRPMVIGYRQHWLNWQVMRRMRYQPWVGLPNILCGEFVVPELLQDAMTPEALAAAVVKWLDNPAAAERLARRFDDLHTSLRRNTATAATDAIAQVLSQAGKA